MVDNIKMNEDVGTRNDINEGGEEGKEANW